MSDRFDHTLERKLERKGEEADGAVVDVRRFEVFTGTGRRRRWSTDDKALNGVDPTAWMTDVLTKLVNLWPASRKDELMPCAWAAAQAKTNAIVKPA